MFSRRYFLGVVILASVLLVWFFWPQKPPTNYPSQGTDIIAFGDSLVYGTGGSGGGFVSILSRDLGVPIVNLGVPGDTTADGLIRIDELDEYKPKVVILLLGGNDYLKKVPPEQTFANLGKIIEDIHSRGAVVLLLGVRGGILRDNFASQYKALAKKYNTAFVFDVLDELIGLREYMADSVHPNDKGYQHIAGRVEPVLSGLLK